MLLPKEIKPCPIVEAIIDVSFKASVPEDAVFGIVFNSVKSFYPEFVKLPIIQLPETIRSSDPTLKYLPHYQFSNDTFLFQLGPRKMSFHCSGEYVGWKDFSSHFYEVLDAISLINLVDIVHRTGIRYINFFESDVFKNINLKILMNENPMEAKQIVLNAEIEDGKFINRLQVVHTGTLTVNSMEKTGSIIDIDTFHMEDLSDFFDIYRELIEEGHTAEKKLFFSLLKEDYLESLNPHY